MLVKYCNDEFWNVLPRGRHLRASIISCEVSSHEALSLSTTTLKYSWHYTQYKPQIDDFCQTEMGMDADSFVSNLFPTR